MLQHPLGGPLEEFADFEVAHDQHEAEQEDQHVEVHRGVRLLQRHHAEDHHGDGAQQARGGAVEMDERQPLDRDQQVGGAEDDEPGDHLPAPDPGSNRSLVSVTFSTRSRE